MKFTAVSKLKAAFSEHLELVKAGEEVIVMERGRPIAKIVPLPRPAEAQINPPRILLRSWSDL